MTRLAVLFILFLLSPTASLSTTSDDLRSRIEIDGRASEYEPDEWVLDPTTNFPERKGDSRWGRDNDIISIALTWDFHNVYIVIPCVASNSTLMIFIDTDCGGPKGLEQAEFFRRNIRFADFSPNLLFQAKDSPPFALVGFVDCDHPIDLVDEDRFGAWFLQDGINGGALEAAIPWDLLGRFEKTNGAVRIPENGAVLGLIAALTGGPGTGAGDAAPDPSTVLESDSTRIAFLDNSIRIPLDADEDGYLDVGVSPRDVATFSLTQGNTQRQVTELRLDLEEKVFSPDGGEVLRFLASPENDTPPLPVYLTARIYSTTGKLITVIYEDLPRSFASGAQPVWDVWDGRDYGGNVVPGGIYILVVSGGPAQGSTTNVAKASFAVIR
ncbi:MAG: hypothetical protein GTO51_01240 [Candidatus Latescibacteria bacterium]|nr:hypothetical protein [Candidatus Latescibacterota bacterium]NIM21624.1 hypothetical protein [Candidatus Latescibacterota bacterium]NIM64603.1 hypothetical protein [Candidatus Latescibacterota bacterium]NIO01118.1 hypothetical protein [Candidatus Latescibacterota bacterium]NIO27511.1 hypothetical protein [Candidatus Latescibacterota bacterium]